MTSFLSHLAPSDLEQLRAVLEYDPWIVDGQTGGTLSTMADEKRKVWLLSNVRSLETEFCRLGSWTFGSTKGYGEIVRDSASKVGVISFFQRSIEETELLLMQKLMGNVLQKLSPRDRLELDSQLKLLATRFGKSHTVEISSLAALTAAQLSGFGVYMLGTTLLGALNGALGLGLGFGAFAGLSSMIATATGPIGWTVLGLFTFVKMGAPKYKRIIPAIVIIAAARGRVVGRAEVDPLLPSSSVESASGDAADIESRTSSAIAVEESSSISDSGRKGHEVLTPLEAKHPNPSITLKPSKMERIVFDQSPGNRDLRTVANEYYGCHFLDLTAAEQSAVREEVSDRLILIRDESRNTIETASAPPAQAARNRMTRDARAEKKTKKKLKELRAIYANLEFGEKAAGRLIDFESTELYFSFLSELRMLNEGFLQDKHHVPGTSPKLFQRDCGRDGRLYYRRLSEPKQTFIALLGDKHSQEADYEYMRKLTIDS